nr:MAG: hypothetical protein [Penaeus semisulcatus pemonivirus]
MASSTEKDNKTTRTEASECIGEDCGIGRDGKSKNKHKSLRENRGSLPAIVGESMNTSKNKGDLKGVSQAKNRRHSDGEFLVSTQGKLNTLVGGVRQGGEHSISEEGVLPLTRTDSALTNDPGICDPLSEDIVVNEKDNIDGGECASDKNDEDDVKINGDGNENCEVKSAVSDGDSTIVNVPVPPKKRGRKPKGSFNEGCEHKKPRRVTTTKLEHHPDESECEGSNLPNQYKGDLTIVKDFCVHVHLCIPMDMETTTSDRNTGCGSTSNISCHDVE